jgi:cell division protein FtsW
MTRLRMDWVLFLTVVAMTAFGLVMVYSASSIMAEVRMHERSYYFLARQAGAALLGFLMMMLLSHGDYRRLASARVAFTGLGAIVILLMLAYVLDSKDHRWIRLGVTNLQPAELAKPALVVFLAWFLSHREGLVNSKHSLLQAALAVAMLGGIVLYPDFGTAVVLVGTALGLLFVAGIDKRYLAAAVVGGMLILGVAVAAKPFRLLRVIAFVDPGFKTIQTTELGTRVLKYAQSRSKVQDTNYHGMQSRIAVAVGGVTGKGLMGSWQKLMFLPAAHTDYIYAIVGEELGLIGCLALLSGFVVVLWRGYRLYWTALDDFGRYLAVGVTTCIVLQAFINISVVLDMGPSKGIPLPLISYGGSSLVSSMILCGILLSVSMRSVETVEA